jgi:hypothetical protein
MFVRARMCTCVRLQVQDSCGGLSEVLTARVSVASPNTPAADGGGARRLLAAADFWAKAQAKVTALPHAIRVTSL